MNKCKENVTFLIGNFVELRLKIVKSIFLWSQYFKNRGGNKH